MTEELRAKMEKLRAIAPHLNKTSDTARTIIKTVEKFLNDLGIGVSASAFYQEDLAEPGDDGKARKLCSYLSYGRHAGEFCIHIARQTTHEEINTYGFMDDIAEAEEQEGWSSLPREEKLRSFSALPRLLGFILDNANARVAEADEAASQIGEMLKTLGLDDSETGSAAGQPEAINTVKSPKRKS